MNHTARRGIQLTVAAAAAVLAAGCSSSTTSPAAQPTGTATSAVTQAPQPATPVVAHADPAAIGAVPWDKVGPGWTLATWSPVTAHRPGEQRAPGEADPDSAATTLFLVDPAGNRFTIATLAGADARLRLTDWSGDGGTALFESTDYPGPSKIIAVDLHTGTQTTVGAQGYPSFTRPNGQALLLSTPFMGGTPGTLTRIGLDGTVQQHYPTEDLGGAGQFSGHYLASLDGTRLVLSTANLGNELVPRSDDSLVVVGNDGTIIRTLPTPMANADCAPVRWWKPEVVLAACSAEHGSATQLWRVPIDGGAASPLTALNSGQGDDPGFGGDLGDGIAWELPTGTFLQSTGACGTAFLSRLTADGHTTRVDVPGMSDSVFVVGATADRLVLQGHVGCGGGTALVSYDPAANSSTVLLGPSVNGGSVTEALLYPEQS